MNRRVLVVGYTYPDQNMGSVRLRRLCRLLPQHGWDPIVLTHAGGQPPGSTAALPDGGRLEFVAAPDLGQIYQRFAHPFRPVNPNTPSTNAPVPKPPPQNGPAEKTAPAAPAVRDTRLTSQLNRWLMVPDKQRPWLQPAVRRGQELLRTEQFDAIFATLDPRTALLVAARLSKSSGVPAVVEYRDLWVGNPYYHLTQPTPLHRAWHSHLERTVIREAARVSVVCEGIQEYLTRAYGDLLRAPVELNYNFYDPAEYPAPAPRNDAEPFTVSHAGNMYASRTPHQFFEGMQAFITQHQLTPARFRFRWAGGLSGISGLDAVLDRTGVRPFIDFLGQIPHRAALQLLVDSDVSLLLQAPDDTIHIPGKLFEALGARVPILALANPCETSRIIESCRAGLVCRHSKEAVAQTLTQFYQRRQQRLPWDFNEPRREEFSAERAVAKLARLFASVAGQPTTRL
jgi:glycosyltransferase involved in cell wall biosynthesis